MQAVNILKVLYKMNILSPLHLKYLTGSVYKYGINIMMLMDFAGKAYGNRVALVDDEEELSFQELADQSEKLACMLQNQYGLEEGQKVAFLCKNHISLVKAVFAASRLGLDLYLLNPEMGKNQFNHLIERHHFDFLVYDAEMVHMVEQSQYKNDKLDTSHILSYSVQINQDRKILRTSMSKIILLTGGTTGESKEVAHQPSILNYLKPFAALFTRLGLLQCRTAFIATPIYHGYGIAVLLSFIVLGKKVVISRNFNAEKACSLIFKHQVDVVTVVPLMIHRMLDANVEKLKSLNCVASGGAELPPNLIDRVFQELGDVLYNLYGTSETGLNIIATPEDLRSSPKTLGRVIKGMDIQVTNCRHEKLAEGEIGQLCVKNKWSMINTDRSWMGTGDLGYQDDKGYYYFCGRTDDMIVSGGENVYPIELERLLLDHPQVEAAAVVGIADEQFGRRLKAFIQSTKTGVLNKEELVEWLKQNAARFHLPKEIVFVDSLPYTPLGKLDKKQLLSTVYQQT